MSAFRDLLIANNSQELQEEVLGLPEGYTEIEYIESAGKQWIDTGITPKVSDKVEIDFLYTKVSTTVSGTFVFNTERNNYLYNGIRCWLFSGSLYMYWGIHGNSSDRHDYIAHNGKIYCNNHNGDAVLSTYSSISNTLILFALLPTGTNASYCKIYTVKINNKPLIPCINPNGIAGLYNTISGEFLKSQGSSEFIAGPVVN